MILPLILLNLSIAPNISPQEELERMKNISLVIEKIEVAQIKKRYRPEVEEEIGKEREGKKEDERERGKEEEEEKKFKFSRY